MRHVPDTDDVERMIERRLASVTDRLRTMRTHLAQLNHEAANSRRFKRGPFDMTIDNERAAVIKVLDVMVAALTGDMPKEPTNG